MRELKKRKKWPKIAMIAAAVCFSILAAAALWGYSLRITEVEIEGNVIYTDEELEEMIFSNDMEKRTVYQYWKSWKGEAKKIPFVGKYEVKFDGLHSCKVIVYEKTMIGCLSYMGCYMYFDRDGIVAESSFERLADVPLIEGIRFDNVILGEKLPVEDPKIFSTILNLTQQLSKYEVAIDEICFPSSSRIYFQIGEVRVELGDEAYLEEKLAKLSSIWKELDGLNGTLYMDTYDGTGKGDFIFKKN